MMTVPKKLNAVMASGLMIGPILGSGIVFLPPLAYEALGEQAIVAWLIMMALGTLFAYVFARMTAVAKDNQGVSAVVGNMLGKRLGRLAANYLTVAVLFGPIAVALTAADFLGLLLPDMENSAKLIAAAVILVISAVLVLSDVAFLGRLMLVLSSLTACLLMAGSLSTLLGAPSVVLPRSFPPVDKTGHTLLLIFWAVVGWEVLGNFTEDVANPSRTLMRAMKISVSVIVLVYLVTAFALQNSLDGSMPGLFKPLFGAFAPPLFGLIAMCLCILTIVTFTGAVARQTAARMKAIHLPAIFKKNWASVIALLAMNLLVLALNGLGWLSFGNIVTMANTLFIGNAVLGLAGGFRLLRSTSLRVGISILLLMMLAIFIFSPAGALVFFAAVTIGSLFFKL